MAPQPGNFTAELLNAMQALTRVLEKNYDHLREQEDKDQSRPVKLRRTTEPQPERLFEDDPSWGGNPPVPRPRSRRSWGSSPHPPDSAERAQASQPSRPSDETPFKTFQSIRQQAQQGPGGWANRWAGALTDFANQQNQQSNLPPDSTQRTQGGSSGPSPGLGGPPGGPGGAHGMFGTPSDQSMMTWALLGEHGGPSFIRNPAMEYWAWNRSVNWAQQAAGQMQQTIASGGTGSGLPVIGNPKTMGALEGVLSFAKAHPLATYAAYKGASALRTGMGHISGGLQGWEDQGAALGVPTSPTRYVFGFRNPISPFSSGATSVGAGAEINKLQLEGRLPGSMGTSLSPTQAKDAIRVIEQQGWGANENKFGGGDIGSLSQQFMGPMMKRYPGLSAEDLGQFMYMFRNSGTSIDQLKDSLSDLGQAAKTTHETIGEAASSMEAFNQATNGMGSSQGGMNAAQGFRSITGMDPQISGQLLQSPIVQGLALTHGILPSALRDVSPGFQTGIQRDAIKMMMNATRGLNRDIKGPGGQVILNGKQAQIDQVAKMLGIQHPEDITKIMNDAHGEDLRQHIWQALGDSKNGLTAGFEGMTGGGKFNMTDAGRAKAQQYWMKNIAPQLSGLGLSKNKIHELNNMGFSQRIKTLKDNLTANAGQDTQNQLQQHPNAQTVNVQFKGAAAKLFEVSGPTNAKQAANAGVLSISKELNSIMGGVEAHGGGGISLSGVANSLINAVTN